jgi:hypothetical protein
MSMTDERSSGRNGRNRYGASSNSLSKILGNLDV